VAEDFIGRHGANKRTSRAIELRVRRELISRWRDRPIDQVTRADVVAMVDALVDAGTPAAADQTLRYCRRIFTWAIARGVLDRSPCDHLRASDLIGTRQPRQRLLSDSELRLIWCVADELPYPDGPYIKMLLLTAVRRSELATATWHEIDLERAIWVVPPTRMKMAIGHAVPLSPFALDILRSLPRFAGSNYVFTARGNRPLNDFGTVKSRMDTRITVLNGGRPIEHWTFHDTRRLVRSTMSRLRIDSDAAEAVLAHRKRGIRATYDLYDLLAEKRRAWKCGARTWPPLSSRRRPRMSSRFRCARRRDGLKCEDLVLEWLSSARPERISRRSS